MHFLSDMRFVRIDFKKMRCGWGRELAGRLNLEGNEGISPGKLYARQSGV